MLSGTNYNCSLSYKIIEMDNFLLKEFLNIQLLLSEKEFLLVCIFFS